MAIKIGTATSLGKVQNWTVIPDDRQTKTQTMDSPYIFIVDNGRREAGDSYQFTATFTAANWTIVKGYWMKRTLVSVVTDSGETFTNRRVIVKQWTWPAGFEKTYVNATIELWGA
jgi:hypothetical protein